MLDGVKSQMDRVRQLTVQTLEITRLINQHRAIVTAIAGQDVDGAEAAMRVHLRTILEDLDIHLSLSPDLFDDIDSNWRHTNRMQIADLD